MEHIGCYIRMSFTINLSDYNSCQNNRPGNIVAVGGSMGQIETAYSDFAAIYYNFCFFYRRCPFYLLQVTYTNFHFPISFCLNIGLSLLIFIFTFFMENLCQVAARFFTFQCQF